MWALHAATSDKNFEDERKNVASNCSLSRTRRFMQPANFKFQLGVLLQRGRNFEKAISLGSVQMRSKLCSGCLHAAFEPSRPKISKLRRSTSNKERLRKQIGRDRWELWIVFRQILGWKETCRKQTANLCSAASQLWIEGIQCHATVVYCAAVSTESAQLLFWCKP